ncbi:hypothetical protein [Priestia megaterium]|uniref:hypothetical protein n=1 Tax=Priestia megaterium TaxID=1404 RepID=UPI00300B0C41
MIGGRDEDSWRLSGRPRKAKSCTEINNYGVISRLAHESHLFVFRWDSFSIS